MRISHFGIIAAAMVLAPALALSQQVGDQRGGPDSPVTPAQELRPDYVLGANDQILIRAFEVDEINEKPFRVETDGTITLPLVGSIKAAGLTVQELETDLTTRLKVYVRDPHVTISVTQFRAEVVFFVGAFQRPGIYPLAGRRNLVEMLSSIGGLQPNASRRIKVSRRAESGPLPLPNAVSDLERHVSSAEINIGSLRNNVNPAEDIVLAPYDTISVERAEQVYIQGEFGRTGAFDLGERDYISVLQIITLAGGLAPTADAKKAVILRPVLDTSRRAEIPINLNDILSTRAHDVPLLPNDVLYVPRLSQASQKLSKNALLIYPIVSSVVLLLLRR